MASMQIEAFGDLVELTLNKFERGSYTSLLTDLQKHPAAKQLVKKSRMNHQGGPNYEFKVRMGTANSFRQISPTTPDQTRITDDFESASVPFRKREISYAFLDEMVDFQSAPEKIVDLVKAKEHGADFDFIEGMENEFWAFPLATNTLNVYSLPYWCTKSASTGFNGGTPTGYSTVADLNTTTWPRWNNYTAQYTNVTIDDMIYKARTMAEETDFEPPVSAVPDLGAAKASSLGYYTNLTVKQRFEDAADSRNDNLGPDVAKHDNSAMFRRAKINYVPRLNADTTDPFYQINWDVFNIVVKTGWWNRRTLLKPYPGQRNQCAVFKDTYYNFVCFNRRALGVLATGTTYPVSI